MCGFDMPMGHFRPAAGPLAHSVRDCLEIFKLQSASNAHLHDPFQSTTPFNQKMLEEVSDHPSKIKVGIITETPYLPVSKSVKRAMGIAKDALVKLGYQVVDFDVTPEDFAKGRN